MSSHYSEPSTYTTEFNATPPPQGFNLNIKRLLRQGLPVIIIVTLVLAIPACAAVWYFVPLEYAVSGQLRFSSRDTRVLYEADSQKGVDYQKWLATQIALLESPDVLRRVAENPSVREIPQVQASREPVRLLDGKISIGSERNTELVEVIAHMPVREHAEVIVNALMEEYQEYASAQEQSINKQIRDQLNAREIRLREERDIQQLELGALQKELGRPLETMGRLGAGEEEAFNEEFAKAQASLLDFQSKLAAAERQVEQLGELDARYASNPSAEIYELDIEDAVNQDPSVVSLQSRVRDMEATVLLDRDRYQPGRQELKVKENELASLQAALARTRVDVRGKMLQAAREQLAATRDELQRSVDAANDQLGNFEGRLAEIQTKHDAAATIIAQIHEKQARIDELNENLKQVQDRINEVQIESQAPGRISVASQPVLPNTPDYSTHIQLMVLAVFGAMMAGFAAALLRELLNQRAESPQDLTQITNLPVLATIPDPKMDRLPKDHQPTMIMADYPDSPTADQFRRILARIIYPPDDTVEVNSCLIASPTRGDGKTVLACNLAISLAQANRRVLLVDCCHRDPQAAKSFGAVEGDGLSEVLSGEVDLPMALQDTEFENLKVMGPGLDVSELKGKMAAREMMQFLETAEKQFDHIIIDAPPALLMSDAKLLSPIVDAVIVAVGSRSSTLGMVRRCLSELQRDNANIIGLVLSGVRHTRGGYLAKNLSLFYGYENGNGHSNGHAKRDLNGAADLPEMKIVDEESDQESARLLLAEDKPRPRRKH